MIGADESQPPAGELDRADWSDLPEEFQPLFKHMQHRLRFLERENRKLRAQSAHWRVRALSKRAKRLPLDSLPMGVGVSPNRVSALLDPEREQMLATAIHHLDAIVSALPDLVFRMSRDGYYLDVRVTDPDILYVPIERIVGQRLHDRMPQEHADRFLALIAATLDHHQMQIAEYELPVAKGLRTFEARFVVAGKDEVVVVVRDITEQRAAERALQRANTQLEALNQHLQHTNDVLSTIFDNLTNGLLLIDGNNQVVTINQALPAIMRCTPDQILAKPWEWLGWLKPELLERVRSSGNPIRMQESFISREELQVTIDIGIFPVLDWKQQPTPVIVDIIDVTEKIQMEKLVIQNERLVAAGRLAAMVAHEVNSPLQAIRSLLYLIETSNDQERGNYVTLATNEIQRVSNILRQLLNISRHGNEVPQFVDIGMLIERVLLLTQATLTRRQVQIICNLTSEPLLIWGRDDHLTQVLLNLLLNAADAMEHGGVLEIYTSVQQKVEDEWQEQPTHGHQALIAITDSGHGISPEVQRQIFEPFFTTRADGTGLGLAVSKMIVTQHGGDLDVQSTPGQGTTFTILLPLVT